MNRKFETKATGYLRKNGELNYEISAFAGMTGKRLNNSRSGVYRSIDADVRARLQKGCAIELSLNHSIKTNGRSLLHTIVLIPPSFHLPDINDLPGVISIVCTNMCNGRIPLCEFTIIRRLDSMFPFCKYAV